MQVDQLSISLPPYLLTFLADYQHTHTVSSPSEVIVRALELLQEQELAAQVHQTAAETQTLAKTDEVAEQAGPTVLQRMGGLPQHLLSVGGLSDRDTRRALIAARVEARHQARS
jgi:hypothetical protein